MATSMAWVQLGAVPHPLFQHSSIRVSRPLQLTCDSHIVPFPGPNAGPLLEAATTPFLPSRICPHATEASVALNPVLQTVPHVPLCHTSNLPDEVSLPFSRRTVMAAVK